MKISMNLEMNRKELNSIRNLEEKICEVFNLKASEMKGLDIEIEVHSKLSKMFYLLKLHDNLKFKISLNLNSDLINRISEVSCNSLEIIKPLVNLLKNVNPELKNILSEINDISKDLKPIKIKKEVNNTDSWEDVIEN